MNKRGLVLGFFQDQEIALTILQTIRRKWHYRSALVHKDSQGKISVNDYDIHSGPAAIWGSLGGLIAGLIAGRLFQHFLAPSGFLTPLTIVILSIALGALVGAGLAAVLDFGVRDAMIV